MPLCHSLLLQLPAPVRPHRLPPQSTAGAQDSSSSGWEEREACQQQHMAACVDPQLPACQRHARDFCADAFASPTADALVPKKKQAHTRDR